MYTLLRSSHPATGVEHSLSCFFFNTSEKNLVVAGANVLRVFRLVPDLENKNNVDQEQESNRLKMECLASWELFGWVQSITCARLTVSLQYGDLKQNAYVAGVNGMTGLKVPGVNMRSTCLAT